MDAPQTAERSSLDELFPVSEIPARLEPVLGRRVSRQSVWRWITRGIDGKRLRVVACGRWKATTERWLSEFLLAGNDVTEAVADDDRDAATLRKHGLEGE